MPRAFLWDTSLSTTNWILYLALALLLVSGALALYAWREPGGRQRVVPAALRAAALALALLLVFDPWLPELALGARGRPFVLLDDSWSMRLPAGPDGTSRWEGAVEQVRALGADRVSLLSGASVGAAGLEGRMPEAVHSRLVPGVRAALEAGARELVVVSDGGITDLDEATRLIAEAEAGLRVVAVGDGAGRGPRNAAVAGVDAPRSGRGGASVPVRVDVAALGFEGDSLRVLLERDGVAVSAADVVAPGDGRRGTVELSLELPAGQERTRLRLSARVVARGGDVHAEDDVRPFYIDVEERPRGIVLLSIRPDWEPRFLMPVLERSSGLPVRGYLRTPTGAYLTVGTGSGVARRVPEAQVRADLERASVAVLHGVGDGAPAWLRDRLSHPRLLVFPGEAAATAGLPGPLGAAAAGDAQPGDWYVEARPPASPVAPLIASLSLESLPPLTSLRSVDVPPGAWSPLLARRDRRGQASPVAIAGGGAQRRWVVATGSGYWRWALRGGDARRAYDLFWSSLTGWLTEDLGADAGDAIRPDPAVVERGAPVVWRVAGDADTLRLRIEGSDGAAIDTAVAIAPDRSARTPALEPGIRRWRASAGDVQAEGELAVAAWSPEFVRAAREAPALSAREATLGAGDAGGRRLHARAWPWILLVGLLCGEWILRRRLGLR